MPRARVCSECSASLAGKPSQTKTCSQKCRSARSRRLRDANKRAGETRSMPEHQKELQQIVRGEKDDVAQRIVEQELRPVVREAITEDVLRGIADLVALTPDAVAAVAQDLASEDATVRQRAYGLLLKYTLGNAAVAPTDENTGKQLVVNFALPRPDDTTGEDPVQVESDVTKECDTCRASKPAGEFVDGSDRCSTCWEEQRAKVLERFGD